MNQVRIATYKDKEQFQSLWEICFGDSRAFTDWFFRERFVPEYCVCLEENNRIVSCMQAYPLCLRIRGKLVEGAMLCGVCTHPDFRKKGYMGQIFTAEMKLLRQKNIVVTFHTPAVLESYFSFGHFPVADAGIMIADKIPEGIQKASGIEMVSGEYPFVMGELFDCYRSFSYHYSGMVCRTMADFMIKAADYRADGGLCMAYREDGMIKAYAFYYKTDKLLQATELVSTDIQSAKKLLEGLFYEGQGLAFQGKLPPEYEFAFPFAKISCQQRGVMGGVNLPALLNSISSEKGYPIGIKDEVVPENNGVFYLDGTVSAESPVLEISAGGLIQVLIGYLTLEECEVSGKAKILHREKALQLSGLFPKETCYIIDEY